MLKNQKALGSLKAENANIVEYSLLGYTKGFKKALRHAICFSPNVKPGDFDLEKDVIDGHLVDD